MYSNSKNIVMQITLKDIAEKTGFSITTVSRALGGYDDVNEQTRAIIIETAQELGYRPNLVARQLRSQSTQTIGLIIPASSTGLDDDFFSILLKGASHTAARYHYDILISTHLPNEDEMEVYYRIVGGSRVDGMIVARTHRDDKRIHYLKEMQHPFVVSGRTPPSEEANFPYIDVDSQYGLHQLVKHFAALGHRHIGLILSPEDMAFTPYRLAGYKQGLDDSQIAYRPQYVANGDLSGQSGEAAATQLLDSQPELTAIIACNDLMAIGAMRAIQARGGAVGAEIAVGGFDDIPLSAHTTPSLTTIRQPIYTIGEQLAQMLINIIEGHPSDSLHQLLEPKLIVRESSGYPKR
jgi:LacI family transcriptional regulator